MRIELLKKEGLTLEEAVKLATDIETAARSNAVVKNAEEAAALSEYRRGKRNANKDKDTAKKTPTCNGCGQELYGINNKERKTKCKAFGKVNCPCCLPNHLKGYAKEKAWPLLSMKQPPPSPTRPVSRQLITSSLRSMCHQIPSRIKR